MPQLSNVYIIPHADRKGDRQLVVVQRAANSSTLSSRRFLHCSLSRHATQPQASVSSSSSPSGSSPSSLCDRSSTLLPPGTAGQLWVHWASAPTKPHPTPPPPIARAPPLSSPRPRTSPTVQRSAQPGRATCSPLRPGRQRVSRRPARPCTHPRILSALAPCSPQHVSKALKSAESSAEQGFSSMFLAAGDQSYLDASNSDGLMEVRAEIAFSHLKSVAL